MTFIAKKKNEKHRFAENAFKSFDTGQKVLYPL